MSREHDDRELIDRARDGDTEAFGALWREHAPAARRFALRTTRTFDADDLVSEAYLRILAAFQAGRGPTGPFRPYLFVTIRNIAVSWARRNREDDLEEAESIPDPRATDTAILAAVDENLTMRAFRSLPERWQRVLWLTEVENLQPQAIAADMGLRANGVAALAYRAREGLRQAWIQSHIDESAAGSDHKWALERVGKWARNGLSSRDELKMSNHLADCDACSVIAAEAKDTSSSFTTMLLPLAAGLTGTAGLGWIAVSGAAAADDPTPQAASQQTSHAAGQPRAAQVISTVRRHRRSIIVIAAGMVLIAGGGTAWSVIANHPEKKEPTAPSVTSTSSGETPATARDTSESDAPRIPAPSSTRAATPTNAPTASGTRGSQEASTAGPQADDGPATSRTQDEPPAAAPTVQRPVITVVDTASGAYYPVVHGTAEPGAQVRITARTGTLTTVTAHDDGTWATGSLTGFPAGTANITATTSGGTATVSATVRQPIVSTSFNGSTVIVQVTGVAGATYRAAWDGTSIGSAAADANGAATITGTVSTTGQHNVTVTAAIGDRTGPTTEVAVRF